MSSSSSLVPDAATATTAFVVVVVVGKFEDKVDPIRSAAAVPMACLIILFLVESVVVQMSALNGECEGVLCLSMPVKNS